MKGTHFHLDVRSLTKTIAWLKRMLDVKPVYRDADMAVLPFGPVSVIFDKSKKDSRAILAYTSRNCDTDYRRLRRRGVRSLEAPTDRSWGVRSAYMKGPGALTIEIEQPLRGRRPS